MKLSIGIVGLPNVGKSTLFKLLTTQEVNIANYPFATIDPNVGVVAVPDERLNKLAQISYSKKIIPAVVEFYDIAGLVKGAYKGEGLGNQFLSHIREVNAIVQVVRCFPAGEIIHIDAEINPIRDVEIINTELILKDLETVEKRLIKAEKDAKSGDKEAIKDLEILKELKEGLGQNKLALNIESIFPHSSVSSPHSSALLKELSLLTAKPQIYLLNGSESDVSDELKNEIKELNADYLVINLASAYEEVSIPRSLASSPRESALISGLIRKAYEILGLISFLTTGEDETRAWTIQKGTKTPQAAGVIHTDFEKKFIRAEVINWEKLLTAGSWVNTKQKGWIRLEGKDYIVQDGDVIIVRHG